MEVRHRQAKQKQSNHINEEEILSSHSSLLRSFPQQKKKKKRRAREREKKKTYSYVYTKTASSSSTDGRIARRRQLLPRPTSVNYYLVYWQRRRRIGKKNSVRLRVVQIQPDAYWLNNTKERIFRRREKERERERKKTHLQ